MDSLLPSQRTLESMNPTDRQESVSLKVQLEGGHQRSGWPSGVWRGQRIRPSIIPHIFEHCPVASTIFIPRRHGHKKNCTSKALKGDLLLNLEN